MSQTERTVAELESNPTSWAAGAIEKLWQTVIMDCQTSRKSAKEIDQKDRKA